MTQEELLKQVMNEMENNSQQALIKCDKKAKEYKETFNKLVAEKGAASHDEVLKELGWKSPFTIREDFPKDLSVSKEMHDAACDYANKNGDTVLMSPLLALELAFKNGVNWQKEQMMTKAVDGEVGYWNIRGLSVNMELPSKLEEGDKVKIIVIKED